VIERASGRTVGAEIGLCVNPEFLREGTAISDFQTPPFTVIGSSDARSGDLVEGKGPIDVLRATLPAGTVSGAPKVRAMEIIDDLEPVKRGPYAGVVGYAVVVDAPIALCAFIGVEVGDAHVRVVPRRQLAAERDHSGAQTHEDHDRPDGARKDTDHGRQR